MIQKPCTEHHTRQENLLKKKTVEARNYKGVIKKYNLVNTGIRYTNRFWGKEPVLDIQKYTKLSSVDPWQVCEVEGTTNTYPETNDSRLTATVEGTTDLFSLSEFPEATDSRLTVTVEGTTDLLSTRPTTDPFICILIE